MVWTFAASLFGLVTLASADSGPGLAPLDYELFGTTTRYDKAFEYLKSHHANDLPRTFSNVSLQGLHNHLVGDQCKPVLFYFVGRHAARFPDGWEIEQHNGHLKTLQAELSSLNADELRDFLAWEPTMMPKYDNLITAIGAKEERAIARRLRTIYPEFFDANTTEINFGVTGKIRTAQTAAQFLSQTKHLDLPHCNVDCLPMDGVVGPSYDSDKVKDSVCYQDIIRDHHNPILDFHKQCTKIRGKEAKKYLDPLVKHLKRPELKAQIASRVSERLGLSAAGRGQTITPAVVDSIYGMCTFEIVLKGSSVWCKLLDKRDVEYYEYIEDAKGHIKNAYGPGANAKQACPVIKNLLETMKRVTHSSQKLEAHFLFTHGVPMKKIMAAFQLFKDEQSFTKSRILNMDDIPRGRNWRLSLTVPFSANIEFVVYKCPRGEFKVLTAVNEHPVQIPACGSEICPLERFQKKFKHLLSCNLNKICAKSSPMQKIISQVSSALKLIKSDSSALKL